MNYFQSYSLPVDETILTAWDSQISDAADMPPLAKELAAQGKDLFPRFVRCYAQLRALPRGARRALQRRLAHSGVLTTVPVQRQQKLAGSLAGAALLLALAGTAQANTIAVNTSNPVINPADGKCSLIEAIQNANDTTTGQPNVNCAAGDPIGADTILLPKDSVHTLTASFEDYNGATGLPVITSQVTIKSKDSDDPAKITRGSAAPKFRILAVSASAGHLTLDGVRISGGFIEYDAYSPYTTGRGGGVFNAGALTITGKSTISKNRAERAGGGVFNSGTLTVTNSTVTGNTAGNTSIGATGLGGGIFNSGTATMTYSDISTNKADYGGGLFNRADYPIYSSFMLGNSTISGNTAVYAGGGILNGHVGILDHSTVTANVAGQGGGIFNDGSTDGSLAIINSSTISENTAYEGGAIHNNGVLSIDESTVSGNTAKFKSVTVTYDGTYYTLLIGGKGGGLFNSGSAEIINSTISGNIARGKVVDGFSYGAPVSDLKGGGKGGGIYNYFGLHQSSGLYLNNSTITKNTARFYGGGIFNGDYSSYTAVGSSITENKAPQGPNVYP